MKPTANPPHRSKNPAVLINDIELILKVFIKTPPVFFALPPACPSVVFPVMLFVPHAQAAHCFFSFN